MNTVRQFSPNETIIVQNTDCVDNSEAKVVHARNISPSPKVSVIVPVYNLADNLEESIESILNQNLQDFEIIAVDDGSTDSSLEILIEFAKKDPRITVLSQKNSFAGVARNAGISVATGEYLLFLDGDDFFEQDLLSVVANFMDRDKSDVAIFQYKYFNTETNADENEIKGINKRIADLDENNHILVNTADISDELFTFSNPMPWNKMFRASFVKDNNLRFQNLVLSNDVYFSDTALSISNKISVIYKAFVHYRYNNSSSLRNRRDEFPYCFYECYSAIHEFLVNHNIWKTYKATFLNSFASTIIFTIDKVFLKKNEVKLFVKHKVIPEFFKTDEDYSCVKESNLAKLKKFGVLDESIPEPVISITSFPARIATVNQTIESIINQNYPYKCITLWLAHSQFPNKFADIPKELNRLYEAKSLIIDWCDDTKSYKKLIPSLKIYKDDPIITIDDDLIYPVDWLERLVNAYKADPQSIHTMRAHGLIIDTLLNIQPYSTWKSNLSEANKSYFNFFTGVGGVLYPPNSLSKNVLNEKAMLKLCPNADDIWFWGNALLNRTKVNLVTPNIGKLNYVPGSQDGDTPLWKMNVTMGLNDLRMKTMIEKYPEVIDVLFEEITHAKTTRKFLGMIRITKSDNNSDVSEYYYRRVSICGYTLYLYRKTPNYRQRKLLFISCLKVCK
jgi:glycosyltransferase involved in cell wall biosynthesis